MNPTLPRYPTIPNGYALIPSGNHPYQIAGILKGNALNDWQPLSDLDTALDGNNTFYIQLVGPQAATVAFYTGNVTTLNVHEVFVYGANIDGFNGAGSAGYASFNVIGNRWREFNYGSKPQGWKGCWNVKGQTGPMMGTKGKSYGLITVTRPGAKRSISADQMIGNIQELYNHATECPDLSFLVAQGPETGLNGYTGPEMANFFAYAEIPTNVAFQQEFAKLVAAATRTPLAATPVNR